MDNNNQIGTTEFDFISEAGDMFVDSISTSGDAPYTAALGKTAVEL